MKMPHTFCWLFLFHRTAHNGRFRLVGGSSFLFCFVFPFHLFHPSRRQLPSGTHLLFSRVKVVLVVTIPSRREEKEYGGAPLRRFTGLTHKWHTLPLLVHWQGLRCMTAKAAKRPGKIPAMFPFGGRQRGEKTWLLGNMVECTHLLGCRLSVRILKISSSDSTVEQSWRTTGLSRCYWGLLFLSAESMSNS